MEESLMLMIRKHRLFFLIKTQRTASPHRQPTAPTLGRPLKDINVKEGQPIILTCQIQGFPKSEVSSYLW